MHAKALLEPITLLGLGVVAVWIYVRFPRLRPRTITRAIVHVAISFGLFAVLPAVIRPVLSIGGPLGVALFVAALLIPVLTYVLFSWLAFMAKLHDIADSTPRGGHRVPHGAAG